MRSSGTVLIFCLVLVNAGPASARAVTTAADAIGDAPARADSMAPSGSMTAADSTAASGSTFSREAPAIDLGNGPLVSRDPQGDENLDRFAERSTTAAVLMSIPMPGWGQFYGDTPFWGVVAFSAQMWFYGNIAMQMRRQERQRVARDAFEVGSPEYEFRDALVTEHSERARDFFWWAAGSLLLVSLDAYVSVQLVDFNSPVPPTPDLDQGLGSEVSHGGVVALTLHLPF